MEGIFYDVMSDSEASITNYHYFKNNAVPATLLKFDSDATDAQIMEILNSMKRSFSGSRNKHKIGAVQNLAGIERIQDKTKDMDFLNLRAFTTERIC